MTELNADVIVLGAGVGGVAAALAALDGGSSVILTEETDWIGGQLTSQAVPPDEHPWIEQFGATREYSRFRAGVRDYYRRNYPLTAVAASQAALNPGAGRVSGLTHEPRVALAVLEAMLAPWVASGKLTILMRNRLVRAHVDGDRVTEVEVLDLIDGGTTRLRSGMFVDATEIGELLPLAGIEYVTGAESQTDTGELHAPQIAAPQNMQSVSVCFAMSHHPGEDNTIERPRDYEYWRDYRPGAWGGLPQLGFTAPHRITHELVTMKFDPNPEFDPAVGPTSVDDDLPARTNAWLFRRVLARGHLTTPGVSDITLVNWPSIDYLGGNLFENSAEEAAAHLEAARQQSLSLMYWLQTEAGYPGLKLRGDVVGTRDGLAKAAYHRESRRILGLERVVEQDVSALDRDGLGVRGWRSSVGIGSYRIDLHPSTGGDNYIDIAAYPFEIPLGALIPQRVRNVIAGAKNIATTHITNGCYRLHPVEWNIGEAAGRLAAFCLRAGTEPHAVLSTDETLSDYQRTLETTGVQLHWPRLHSY
ncbi:FAD-dependent oxidoreductase [Salinibacterium sp. G-O1]|uniref:FAD-dependent oxidoreductase n=1 Tax=Salinibacterium sp. G-O1 TaxID=3046208 RepID=UPI0024BA877A|nr:FAD-dependent oxidoreductase [Salinibacterium sp. G-O1]MDJ0333889.1 FAD-dependent oxidoreductase [Salinibacterium sp. G-O1]